MTKNKFRIGSVGETLPHLFALEGKDGSLVYHASQEALDLRFPFAEEMLYPTPWVIQRLFQKEMDPEKVKKQIREMFKAENILGMGGVENYRPGVRVFGGHKWYGFPTTPEQILESFREKLTEVYGKKIEISGLPMEASVANVWEPYKK